MLDFIWNNFVIIGILGFIAFKYLKGNISFRNKSDKINKIGKEVANKHSTHEWYINENIFFGQPSLSTKNVDLSDIQFRLDLPKDLGHLFITNSEEYGNKWILEYYDSNMDYFHTNISLPFPHELKIAFKTSDLIFEQINSGKLSNSEEIREAMYSLNEK